MKIESVPQDDENFYEGHKRAVYAEDESGRYVMSSSKGWEVETFFTALALSDLNERYAKVAADVAAGLVSPLAAHMQYRKWDEVVLAAEAGLWTWQVRRHMRPHIYKKLSPRILKKYAKALGVECHQLNALPVTND